MTICYRRCIACRRYAHRDELIKITRDHKTQQVRLGEGMGRSAYICPTPDCMRLAQKKNRLGRMLRAPIPETLYAELWQHLNQDAESQ